MPYSLAMTHYHSLNFFQLQVISNIFSLYIHLPILDIWYKINYIICGHLWLTSFIQLKVFMVLPCWDMHQYFILYYSILWIYHILFTHSHTEGYLNCFDFLAIMNNFSVNIYVQILYRPNIFISLDYTQEWTALFFETRRVCCWTHCFICYILHVISIFLTAYEKK